MLDLKLQTENSSSPVLAKVIRLDWLLNWWQDDQHTQIRNGGWVFCEIPIKEDEFLNSLFFWWLGYKETIVLVYRE